MQAEKKSLEEKLQVLQQETEQVKAKYQELQQAFDTERAAWASDKKLLEDTIVDMSTSEKHSEEDKNKWAQDLKAQEQRAKVSILVNFRNVIPDQFDRLPRIVTRMSWSLMLNPSRSSTASAKICRPFRMQLVIIRLQRRRLRLNLQRQRVAGSSRGSH